MKFTKILVSAAIYLMADAQKSNVLEVVMAQRPSGPPPDDLPDLTVVDPKCSTGGAGCTNPDIQTDPSQGGPGSGGPPRG